MGVGGGGAAPAPVVLYGAALEAEKQNRTVTFRTTASLRLCLQEQATDALTYGSLWTLRVEGVDLVAVCRIGSCVKTTKLAGAGGAVNVSNAKSHIRAMHPEFLTQKDVPVPAAVGAGAGGAPKKRRADEVVGAAEMSPALVREATTQLVALGMQPFSRQEPGLHAVLQHAGHRAPERIDGAA